MKTQHVLSALLSVCLLLPLALKGQDNMDHKAYQAGESLTYALGYGWIKAGEAEVSLVRTYYKDEMHLHAKIEAHTTGMANRIYNVHDVYESYFRQSDGLPVTTIRDVEEGPRYKKYNKAYFDQENLTLTSEKTGTIDIPESTFDIVSIFYYLRNSVFNDLRDEKDAIHFDLYFDEKVYDMKVLYRGEETVKTKYGEIECMKFVPLVTVGSVFHTEEDVTIWISADNNHIPVKARMNLLIGSFYAKLIDYQLLLYPFGDEEDE